MDISIQTPLSPHTVLSCPTVNVNLDEKEIFYYFTKVIEVKPTFQLNSKISASTNEKLLRINTNCCMKANTKPLHLVLCMWWDLYLKAGSSAWQNRRTVGMLGNEKVKVHFELFAFQQGSILKPAQNVIKPKMWELEPPQMVFQ